jgi:hypothetical protein
MIFVRFYVKKFIKGLLKEADVKLKKTDETKFIN